MSEIIPFANTAVRLLAVVISAKARYLKYIIIIRRRYLGKIHKNI